LSQKPRLRHTALRVRDLETSIEFYTKYLGMKVTRRRTNEMRAHHAAYIAYGDEASHHAIELVQDFDTPNNLEIGNSYWHLNFSLPDMLAVCARMKKDGIDFVEEPAPMSIHPSYHVAFIKDPDGYEIELTDHP